MIDRRVLRPEEIKSAGTFIVSTWSERRALLKWIETNTGGRFFLGQGFVTFEDEGDVIMYRLGPYYDCDRVEKASKLRGWWL